MSRESHRAFLEQAARKAAAQERARRHQARWTVAELKHLKLQTVEPWKRVILGGAGLATVGGGAWAIHADVDWLGIILIVAGLLLISAALIGRRRTVEAVFESIDVVDLFSGIFDAIDF